MQEFRSRWNLASQWYKTVRNQTPESDSRLVWHQAASVTPSKDLKIMNFCYNAKIRIPFYPQFECVFHKQIFKEIYWHLLGNTYEKYGFLNILFKRKVFSQSNKNNKQTADFQTFVEKKTKFHRVEEIYRMPKMYTFHNIW